MGKLFGSKIQFGKLLLLDLTMLDVMTVLSAVGLQQNLADARNERKNGCIFNDEENDTNYLEQAAEQLSQVFDSVEGTLSSGVSSFFGSQIPTALAKATPQPKKIEQPKRID